VGITQLGYVGIGVRDLARWETFATRIVGLELSARDPDGTLYLRLDDYHHRLLLHPSGEDDLLYVGWQVATPQALADLVARLRAAGVSVSPGSPEERAQRRVQGLVKVTAPSGFAFELFYGPLTKPGAPFVPSRPMTGFKAGPLGLGHLVVNVENRDVMERFLTEVLGLRLTDYGAGRLAFFHCNPRHHSIAIGELGPLATHKRLQHVMLEVLSLDDVGTAYDLCLQEGVRITRTLGRHVNDLMVSFYCETPSGFELEIGWGGVEVDDATWEVRSFDRGEVWGHQRLPAGTPPAALLTAAGPAERR
jgi:extradiol dioxygenase